MLPCLWGVLVLLLEAQFGLMCLTFLGDLQGKKRVVAGDPSFRLSCQLWQSVFETRGTCSGEGSEQRGRPESALGLPH